MMAAHAHQQPGSCVAAAGFEELPKLLQSEEDYDSLYVTPFIAMYFDQKDDHRWAAYTNKAIRMINLVDHSGKSLRFNFIGTEKIKQSFSDARFDYQAFVESRSYNLTSVNFVLTVFGSCRLAGEEYAFKSVMISHRYSHDTQLIDVEFLDIHPHFHQLQHSNRNNTSTAPMTTNLMMHHHQQQQQNSAMPLKAINLSRTSLTGSAVAQQSIPRNSTRNSNNQRFVTQKDQSADMVDDQMSNSSSHNHQQHQQDSSEVSQQHNLMNMGSGSNKAVNSRVGSGSYSTALFSNSDSNSNQTSNAGSSSTLQQQQHQSFKGQVTAAALRKNSPIPATANASSASQIINNARGNSSQMNSSGKNFPSSSSSNPTARNNSGNSGRFESSRRTNSSNNQQHGTNRGPRQFKYDDKAIYVQNFPEDCTDQQIIDCFEDVKITSINNMKLPTSRTLVLGSEADQIKVLANEAGYTIGECKLQIEKKRYNLYSNSNNRRFQPRNNNIGAQNNAGSEQNSRRFPVAGNGGSEKPNYSSSNTLNINQQQKTSQDS